MIQQRIKVELPFNRLEFDWVGLGKELFISTFPFWLQSRIGTGTIRVWIDSTYSRVA